MLDLEGNIVYNIINNYKGDSEFMANKKVSKSDIKKAHRILKKMPVAVSIVLVILVVAYFIMDYMGYSIWDIIYRREPVEGQISVHIIDIGQGDSILIETPDGYMLIDTGEKSESDELKTYLRKLGVNTIKYFVLTHAHSDHVGGTEMVLDEFKVENIIYENYWYTDEFIDMLEAEGANMIDPSLGATYSLGEAEFTVLSPDPVDYGDDKNDYSIVLRLDYGESSFIFTGDATKRVENNILENNKPYLLDCDFLKSGHHGSRTSSGEDFIDALSPDIVAISVGKDNKYGLPDEDVLEIYENEKAEIYRTDEMGSLVFVSDGKTITYVEG